MFDSNIRPALVVRKTKGETTFHGLSRDAVIFGNSRKIKRQVEADNSSAEVIAKFVNVVFDEFICGNMRQLVFFGIDFE